MGFEGKEEGDDSIYMHPVIWGIAYNIVMLPRVFWVGFRIGEVVLFFYCLGLRFISFKYIRETVLTLVLVGMTTKAREILAAVLNFEERWFRLLLEISKTQRRCLFKS